MATVYEESEPESTPHAMLSFDDSYREQEEMLGVQEELPQIQKSSESPFNMTTHEGNFKTLAM